MPSAAVQGIVGRCWLRNILYNRIKEKERKPVIYFKSAIVDKLGTNKRRKNPYAEEVYSLNSKS